MNRNMIKNIISGSIVGYGACYLYEKLNPASSISLQEKHRINSYISERSLVTYHGIFVNKILSYLYKSFYYHGLISEMQGYHFHNWYYIKDQLALRQPQTLKSNFCIFSPKQILCGYPNIIHSGFNAILVDQILGDLAAKYAAKSVATTHLDIEFDQPILKDRVYVVEGKINKKIDRQIYTEGEIKDLQTGKIYLKTKIIYKTVDWSNWITNLKGFVYRYI